MTLLVERVEPGLPREGGDSRSTVALPGMPKYPTGDIDVVTVDHMCYLFRLGYAVDVTDDGTKFDVTELSVRGVNAKTKDQTPWLHAVINASRLGIASDLRSDGASWVCIYNGSRSRVDSFVEELSKTLPHEVIEKLRTLIPLVL